MSRIWDHRHYYRNGYFYCLLETCTSGETCISFRSGHTKWRFMQSELRQIALACLQHEESLHALFDYLMDLEGFANEHDQIIFRKELAGAMELLAQVEVET